MKILVTSYVYPPTACGCSVSASVLARGLARRGHDVTVFTTHHPDRQPVPEDAGLRIEAFKITGNYNLKTGIHATPEEIARYRQAILAGDWDLIIFENWDIWSTLLAEKILGQLKTKKIIVSHGYTPHIWPYHPKPFWGIGNWMGGWPLVLRTPFLMWHYDRLVVLSKRPSLGRFFDHWLARRMGYNRVVTIPNGAFAAEFNDPTLPDFRQEMGVGPGLMILYVANYCDRKDQKKAVRVFRQARLKNATLVLIGSELEAYARETQQLDAELQKTYPDGRVLFLEKLTRRQTCAAYRAADLFLLTASAETQPIVLLEAMASHTPWLGTDVGCVAELPGGVTVSTREPDLVAALQHLADSPDRRKQLADEGWRACQATFDWDKVVDAYDRLIHEVVAQP